jgi:large subunit ribosomal protein L24
VAITYIAPHTPSSLPTSYILAATMSNGRQKLMKILLQERPAKKPGYLKTGPPRRWNILAGDTVQVIDRRHPEHGKQGKVMEVIKEKLRVIVEGINVQEEEVEADPARGIQAHTAMKEFPIHYSNVNLVDPVTGFPTRITYSWLNGKKVRISKRSGAIIPRPKIYEPPVSTIPSEDSDTLNEADVWAVTYEERPSKWEDMLMELKRTMEEKGGKLGDDTTS